MINAFEREAYVLFPGFSHAILFSTDGLELVPRPHDMRLRDALMACVGAFGDSMSPDLRRQIDNALLASARAPEVVA